MKKIVIAETPIIIIFLIIVGCERGLFVSIEFVGLTILVLFFLVGWAFLVNNFLEKRNKE